MQPQPRTPSTRQAWLATVIAIVNLGQRFASLADHSSSVLLMPLVFVELVVIALSVWFWVAFVKAFVEFRIQQSREGPVT
jgi:hypothetical protein